MAGAQLIRVKLLAHDDDIVKHYLEHHNLGEGNFGRTVEVTDVNSDDRSMRYAMKIQYRRNKHREYGGPEREFQRMYRELLILNKILPKHRNIIEIHDILVGPQKVYIVQELCKGKDMSEFFFVADNVSGRRAFLQLLEAVQTAHEYGVIHGDIKPENIIFKDPDFRQLKLIDFGCSDYRPDWAIKAHNKFDHTKWLNEDEISPSRDHPRLVDIRGLGKILHGILCGKHMQYTRPDQIYRMQTEFRPRTELFNEAAMDLLSRIGEEPFGPDTVEEIMPLDQVRQHPWLTGAPFHKRKRDETAGNIQMLNQLRNNLTLLRHLLKDWMIIRLTVLRDDTQLSRYYTIRGRLERGTEETGVLDVVDSMTGRNRMAMKVIYGRETEDPQFEPGGFETRDPLLLYMELLITLRILPRHEHIVIIKSVYVSEAYVVLVKELMEGRSMEDFFRLSACITKSRLVFKQLADTVRFLHLHGVVHMDLHPHNIVFKNESPEFCWKIVNFNKARFVPQMGQSRRENFRPRTYLPPQLHERFELGSETDAQVDVTSLGRILHAMLAGRWEPEPARCANLLPRRDIFGDAATDLLSRIGPEPFGPDPNNRTFPVDEICLHPWLQLD